MRFIKFFLLLIFISLFSSCFLTHKGLVKEHEGIIQVDITDGIAIFVEVTRNKYFDETELQDEISRYLSRYYRLPRYKILNSRTFDAPHLLVDVKSLDFNVCDVDKTEEKRLEEKNEYEYLMENYEKELKRAIDTGSELPEKPEPPKEETVLYIERNLTFKYSLSVSLDNSADMREYILGGITKSIVKEHNKRVVSEDRYKISSQTGNPFIDVSLAIFTGILNGLFHSPENDDYIKYSSEYCHKPAEAFLLLKKEIYLDISQKIAGKIDKYFIKYSLKRINLLNIDRITNKIIKDKLKTINGIPEIELYLLSVISNFDPDKRARIYLNLSILNFLNKNDESSRKYFELGSKENFKQSTRYSFNMISNLLGDKFLPDD